MPRRKAPPARASAGERAAASWSSLNTQNTSSDVGGCTSDINGDIVINTDGSESDDVEVISSEESDDDEYFVPLRSRTPILPRKAPVAGVSGETGKKKKRRISTEAAKLHELKRAVKREAAAKGRESKEASRRAAAAQEKAAREQCEAEYAQVACRLSAFDFYVTVRTGKSSAQCCVKNLQLKLKAPRSELPSGEHFWVYVREKTADVIVYYEWTGIHPGSKSKKQSVLATECLDAEIDADDVAFWRALSDVSSYIEVCLVEYDSETGSLILKCHIAEKAFVTLSRPSEEARRGTAGFRSFMQLVLGLNDPEVPYQPVGTFDIDDVYARISKERKADIQKEKDETVSTCDGPDPQHEQLLPQLRPYQKAAVRWMLQREKLPPELPDPVPLHQLYVPITVEDGRRFYYCPLGGWLVRERPEAVPSPPGGILADEMGLGKTVEILSLVLNHHRSDVPKIEPLEVIDLAAYKAEKKREEEEAKMARHRAEMTEKRLKREAEEKARVARIAAAKVWLASRRAENSASSGESVDDSDDVDVKGGEKNNAKCNVKARTVESQRLRKKGCEMNGKDVNRKPSHDSLDTTGHGDFSDKSVSPTSLTAHESKPNGDMKKLEGGDADFDLIEIKHISDSDPPLKVTTSRGKKRKSNSMGSPSKKVRFSEVGIKFDPDDSMDAAIESVILRVCYGNNPPPNYVPGVSELGHSSKPSSKTRISATKRLAQLHYENSLAAISAAQSAPVVVEDQPDLDISCLCGRWQEQRQYLVRCLRCGTYQHAQCVQYDVEDPLRGPYYCPQCWISIPAVKSGATLIVSPSSISEQWVEEIDKHIRREGMRLLVYTGVRSDRYLQPQTLASQDIIVTTYTVFQRELHYTSVGRTDSSGEAGKRRAQRYLAPPTPLLCVDWWRVCLDEAQMVECVTTNTAEMALRLRCVNRWCVTGTPLTESVQDLYGLLYFLGVEPVWVQRWWQQLVYYPFLAGDAEPLHELLNSCLWRTAKTDVFDQIGLPPQTELTIKLQFSPVESYFYRRQQEECGGEARRRLAMLDVAHDTPLRDLERIAVNQLLWPLLSLRQACCHPQVTRGQLMPLHKSTLTMEELLQQLIKRATGDAEEAHRQRNAACNGLAALHALRGQYPAAAELYRSVLRHADELRDRLQTDALQRLHVLHNLGELLEAGHPLPPTTRDHSLKADADKLRGDYMGKHTALVAAAWRAVKEATAEADAHAAKLDAGAARGPWFSAVMTGCAELGSPQDLVERVKQQLRELSDKSSAAEKHANTGVTKRTKAIRTRQPANSLLGRFDSLLGLQVLLVDRLTQLAELRAQTLSAVHFVHGQALSELTPAAVDCHLRPTLEADDPPECQLCSAHSAFERYERQLFFMLEKRVSGAELEGVDGQVSVLGELQRGNWGDNETERVLKTLLTAGRQLGMPQATLQLGQHQINFLDAQKREFKALRVLWMRLRDRVSAADELEMAVLRLRTRYPDEPRPPPGQPAPSHIIEPTAVDDHMARLKADRAVAESDLRRRLGQRLYLTNLRRGARERQAVSPEPCPICQGKMGASWAVLHCGHCFCIQCIQLMVAECTRVVRRYPCVSCAVCRELTRQHEIAYISAVARSGSDSDSDDEDGEVRVRGDHSTKVEAVVRCVLKILREDPDAKTLVFATWIDALDVMAPALRENGVEVRCLHAHGRAQRELREFKKLPYVNVLLLPVHSGANGLNIIEATHVILANPVLDPGEERQAVGRVHRIGQLRPTTVHRLVVGGTIEERILALNAGKQTESVTGQDEEARLTVGDLRQLLGEDELSEP